MNKINCFGINKEKYIYKKKNHHFMNHCYLYNSISNDRNKFPTVNTEYHLKTLVIKIDLNM